MTKTLILGMGNPILGDDGIGLLIADELAGKVDDRVDVKTTASAGFTLVDLLVGYEKLIVVDACMTGKYLPGTPFWMDINELEKPVTNHSNHNLHIAGALRLGRNLGLEIPDTVYVLAVEVEDCFELREEISRSAKMAIPESVNMVVKKLGQI